MDKNASKSNESEIIPVTMDKIASRRGILYMYEQMYDSTKQQSNIFIFNNITAPFSTRAVSSKKNQRVDLYKTNT